MEEYILPYFGQINTENLEEYYNVKTIIKNNNIQIDLNFENKTIDKSEMEVVKNFIENIEKLDKQNKFNIEKDFKDEVFETAEYIAFYLEELDDTELSGIIELNNESISKELQILNKLNLIRVGLYPDGKYGTEYFGVFDYALKIGGENSNQLLVVKTNKLGELDHITWES